MTPSSRELYYLHEQIETLIRFILSYSIAYELPFNIIVRRHNYVWSWLITIQKNAPIGSLSVKRGDRVEQVIIFSGLTVILRSEATKNL
jgi:hypothetical protein